MPRRKILAPDGGKYLNLGKLEPHFKHAAQISASKEDLSVKGVFLNVPYDREHSAIVDAYIITVFDCGFIPRLVIQDVDCGKTRIQKLMDHIVFYPYSIHDLSLRSTDVSEPRLNMAFELGIALGAIKAERGQKKCLIFSDTRYGYQRYISDLSGFDIISHDLNVGTAIKGVRDFCRYLLPNTWLPSVKEISDKLKSFYVAIDEVTGGESEHINYADKILLMSAYLMECER